MRHHSICGCSLALLLLSLSPGPGATERVLPKGLLSLQLSTRATYDDNYFRTDGDERGETSLNTGLALTYQRAGGMFDFSFTGSAEQETQIRSAEPDADSEPLLYSFHPSLTAQDSAWKLTFAADVSQQNDVVDASLKRTGSSTDLGLSASAALAVSKRLNLASDISHQTQSFDDSAFKHLGSSATTTSFSPYYRASHEVSLGIRLGHGWTTYEDSDRAGNGSTSVGPFVSYRPNSRLTVQFGAGVELVEFDSTPTQDAYSENGWYLNASLNYALSGKLSTSLGMKYGVDSSYSVLTSDYPAADPAPLAPGDGSSWPLGIGAEPLESGSSPAGGSYRETAWGLDASLKYTMNSRLSSSLALRHGVEFSYDANSEYRTADSATLSLDYRFTQAFQISTSLAYAFTDADTGTTTNEFLYTISGNYRLNDYLTLTGGYEHGRYDSDAADADFVDNTLHFGMGVSF
jgi:hypothetical protein